MASLETTKGLSRRDRRRMQQYANTVPTERITYWDNSDKTLLPAIRNVYSQTDMSAPVVRQNPVPTDLYANRESAVQTAPATRKRRSTNGSYKVQKGDTLSAIARRYGTTVQAIAEANGITDVNKIYVGDKLVIRGSSTNTSTSNKTTSTNSSKTTITPTTTRQYKVQADRPYNINRDDIQSKKEVTNSIRRNSIYSKPTYVIPEDYNSNQTPTVSQQTNRPFSLSSIPGQNANSTINQMRNSGLRENAGNYITGQLYPAYKTRRYKSNRPKQKKTKNTFNNKQALQQAYKNAMTDRYGW